MNSINNSHSIIRVKSNLPLFNHFNTSVENQYKKQETKSILTHKNISSKNITFPQNAKNILNSDVLHKNAIKKSVTAIVVGQLSLKNLDQVATNKEAISNRKVLKTIKYDPKFLYSAGISIGIQHDRQSLNIILKPNQKLKIRQVNEIFTEKLNLRLLNNNSDTEKIFSIGSSWVDVSNPGAVSVPFIDTPLGKVTPEIEFKYSSAEVLPIFHPGTNKELFFAQWDSQDADFGLVETKYAIILVPKISKNKLKANLDVLPTLYDDVFTFFNDLSGFSFDPKNEIDRIPLARYFIKADITGEGGAYYSDFFAAEGGASIDDIWLNFNDMWGMLHEISHGYEGHLYSFLPEVWNNIYSALYQDARLGDQKYQRGWLYGYGNRPAVENTVMDYIKKSQSLFNWDDKESKVVFLMLMFQKAGSAAFRKFNQEYRKLCSIEEADKISILDLLSKCMISHGVDVTPLMQLVNCSITLDQVKENFNSNTRIVYPLYQLVKPRNLEKIKKQLNLQSSLILVDSTQLKVTKLKGSVTIQFKSKEFLQFSGRNLILMDENRQITKVKINSRTLLLNDLPVGVYRLHIRANKRINPLRVSIRINKQQSAYLFVKEGTHEQKLIFYTSN